MSTHSYSRIWLHLIWETLAREAMLDKRAAARASKFLTEYSSEKGIYMKINYFNAEHTHALIDLPTNKCVEEVIKLFKGGSSYWINDNKLVGGKFAWGKDMAHFPFPTQTWNELPGTSPGKKSIIARRATWKSMSYS